MLAEREAQASIVVEVWCGRCGRQVPAGADECNERGKRRRAVAAERKRASVAVVAAVVVVVVVVVVVDIPAVISPGSRCRRQ